MSFRWNSPLFKSEQKKYVTTLKIHSALFYNSHKNSGDSPVKLCLTGKWNINSVCCAVLVAHVSNATTENRKQVYAVTVLSAVHQIYDGSVYDAAQMFSNVPDNNRSSLYWWSLVE